MKQYFLLSSKGLYLPPIFSLFVVCLGFSLLYVDRVERKEDIFSSIVFGRRAFIRHVVERLKVSSKEVDVRPRVLLDVTPDFQNFRFGETGGVVLRSVVCDQVQVLVSSRDGRDGMLRNMKPITPEDFKSGTGSIFKCIETDKMGNDYFTVCAPIQELGWEVCCQQEEKELMGIFTTVVIISVITVFVLTMVFTWYLKKKEFRGIYSENLDKLEKLILGP